MEPMDRKSLGDKLREIREGRKLTQADAARLSGVSPRSLQDIEAGKGNPGLSAIETLEDFYKRPVIQLHSGGEAQDWAKVFRALADEGPVRVNAGLFLLTKDRMYTDRLLALGKEFAPIVQSLQKLAKVL